MSPCHTLHLTVEDLLVLRSGRPVAAGISFSLSPGQALTLRGVNGTGKTSLLRMIAGFAIPAHGEIRFADGEQVQDPAATRAHDIHWLAAEGLSARMSVGETLRFWSGLLGGSADGVADRVGLRDMTRQPCGALSTGQRRRLGLARLLIADRSLWLLDEPRSGLDAEGDALLDAFCLAHRARGGIVVMAAHGKGSENAATLTLQPAPAAAVGPTDAVT